MLVKIEARILVFSRHGLNFSKHVRASRHVFFQAQTSRRAERPRDATLLRGTAQRYSVQINRAIPETARRYSVQRKIVQIEVVLRP